MRQLFLVLVSLMFLFPQVSPLQFSSSSCDQTWLGGVPNAPLDASFAFSSDGAHMAIGENENEALIPGYSNGTNNLIYVTPQPVPTITFAPLGPPYGPWRIWMSADGYVIVAALKDIGVRLFRQANPEYDWKLSATPFNSLGLSGDGRYVPTLIQNGASNTLYLLSAAHNNIAWSYRFSPSVGNSTSIQPVAISYDGGRIAALLGRTVFVFSNNRNQTLWSKVVESAQTDSSDIIGASETNVFMSQDGNYLTTIEDANITVYSASIGAVERSFILDQDWFTGLGTPDSVFSLSKDSSTMALIDGPKLRVWDRASGTELFSKEILDRIQVGSSMVDEHATSVSLSQNGTVIAVGSGQRGVFVYDRSGNEICKVYDGSSDQGVLFTAVRVSDDGKHVAAFAQDTAALLTITTNYLVALLIGTVVTAAAILGYVSFRHRRKNKRSSRIEPSGQPSNTGDRVKSACSHDGILEWTTLAIIYGYQTRYPLRVGH